MSNKLRILYIGNKLAVHGRTPTSIDTLGKMFEQEGYTLYYSSSKLNSIFRLMDMLSSIWRYQKKIDVVLIDTYSTSAFYYAWASGRLCKLLGIKYIPVLRGGNLPDRIKQSPGLSKQIFANSYTNIAVSGYLQKHMQQAGYKSEIVENNILISNYTFKLRSKLSPKLIWVRAFHATYNPQMAIKLVVKLKDIYPDVQLTMVGPDLDGSMQHCKELCNKLGVEQQVSFTGKLSKQEWTTLAAASDIFINTTNFDNLPVSVIEAMALGLPVITTNVGGIPYLIENGKTGLLVNANDTDEMSRAVQQLINDEQLAEQLSQTGRQKAEQFDWNIIKNKWATLFNTLP